MTQGNGHPLAKASASDTDSTPHAGSPDAPSFETLSRYYRDPYVLRETSEVFAALPALPWLIFTAVYHHLWGNADAWPTQQRMALLTGVCLRTVRAVTRQLEALGVLTSRRVRRRAPFGGYRLFYEPGPALYAALLGHHRKRLARLQAQSEGAAKGEPPSIEELTEPPHAQAAPPVERPFGAQKACGMDTLAHAASHDPDLNLLEILTTSSSPPPPLASLQPPPPDPSEPKEENKQSSIPPEPVERPPASSLASPPAPPSEVDGEVARALLTYRAQRARPTSPLPACWDAAHVTLVATRLAEEDGTAEQKLSRGQAAVDAAFRLSKERTPTLRYIWGTQEHYLEHVRRGLDAQAKEKARQEAHKARERARAEKEALTLTASQSIHEEASAPEAPLTPAEMVHMAAEALRRASEPRPPLRAPRPLPLSLRLERSDQALGLDPEETDGGARLTQELAVRRNEQLARFTAWRRQLDED